MKRLRRYKNKLLKTLSVWGLFLIPFHTTYAFFGEIVEGVGTGLGNVGSLVGGWIMGIVLGVLASVVWIVALVSSVIVGIAATLLDTVINFTILSPVLQNISAINAGWEAARDISNLFFIFILLYIAIATILRVNESGTKRMLATVIIVALLMNFSLFFTKVIIDVSNTIAIGTWSSMYSGGAPLTQKLANAEKLQETMTESDIWFTDTAQKIKSLIVFIGATAIFLTTTMIFLNASFLLIGRLIAFIFLMILAPFAFVSYILPKTRGLIFDKWFSTLINQAIVAPVFVFLLLVVVRILESGKDGSSPFLVSGTGSDTTDALYMLLNFVVITALIYGVLKITRDVSGNIGASASKWGKLGTGILAGGVGGFALRNTVGRGAARLAKTKGGGAIGAGARKFADRTSRVSMDFRDIPGVSGSDAGKDFGKSYGARKSERAKKQKEKKEEKERATISSTNEQLRNISNPAATGAIINNTPLQNIPKLDPAVLANPAVAHNFDIATLNAIMNSKDLKLTPAQRQAIKTAATAGPNGLAVANWLTNGGGVVF